MNNIVDFELESGGARVDSFLLDEVEEVDHSIASFRRRVTQIEAEREVTLTRNFDDVHILVSDV